MKICILAALSLFFALAGASWGRANERVTEFNIAPQSLDSALIAFSKQADVQISVAATAIVGMRTEGVIGRFTPSAALKRILTQTGLEFSAIGDRTFSVALPGSQASTHMASSSAQSDGETWSLPASTTASAQQETPNSYGQASAAAAAASATTEKPRPDVIGEVVVTGTHIRGANAAVGSQLLTIDREEIDRAGFTTVQDLARSLPQNFSGGPNEETWLGAGDAVNSSLASSFNLRGLGSGSTLVLLNGHRMAPAGVDASFTDVSSVPLSAIERVEVLPDGASAIYGADAIGGVVNMVLRRNYDGAETELQWNGADENEGFQASQILGMSWDSGDALLTYEYLERDALFARDRDITQSSDLRRLGGDDFRSPSSNPGTIVIGARTWAIPAGQDGADLTSADLVEGTANRGNSNENISILPEQKRHGGFAALNQQVGDSIRVFANGLYSERKATSYGGGQISNVRVPNTNPFYVHPTGGTATLTVRYNFVNDLGPNQADLDVETALTVVGMEWNIAKEWSFLLEGIYSSEEIEQVNSNRFVPARLTAALADPNPATAFNPFGDGSFTNPATIENLRGTLAFASESTLKSANTVLSGPLVTTASGDIALAVGGEFRRQDFETSAQAATGSTQFLTTKLDRDVSAAFGELRIPLFGRVGGADSSSRIEMSLAARYENYDDFGSATTPRLGLGWAVSPAVKVRGSWARSFKAPSLADQSETGNFLSPGTTPDASGNPAAIIVWSGGNRDLTEERAETWTAGLDFTPSWGRGSQFSVTYFDIEFEDRISPVPFGAYLLDPALAPFVILNPTTEQRQDACSRGTYFGADVAECVNSPITALVDSRAQNVAITKESGIDLQAAYLFPVGSGEMTVGASATYLLEIEQAQLASSPFIEVLNTPRNPADLRLRGMAAWARGVFSASGYVNHVDGYADNVSQPNRSIDSWTTIDLQARVDFESSSEFFDGLSVALTVQNVTDEEPPFFNNSAGIAYDSTNSSLIGRVLSFQVRKTW